MYYPKYTRLTCLFLLILLNLLLVSACHSNNHQVFYLPSTEGSRRAQVAMLIDGLEERGVEVVKIGETMRIILPSDQLFNPESANISPDYVGVLDMVSRLMLILEIPSGKAVGYTNCKPTVRLNKALSEKQAQVVIDYLWDKGIDTRVFYAVGQGSEHPLSADGSAWINRRVEIKFQYTPLAEGGKTCPINTPLVTSGPRSTVQCYETPYEKMIEEQRCKFIRGVRVCRMKMH